MEGKEPRLPAVRALLVKFPEGRQRPPGTWAVYNGYSDSGRKSRILSPKQIARRSEGSENCESESSATRTTTSQRTSR